MMFDERVRKLIGQRRLWRNDDLKCVGITVSTQREYGETGGVEERVQWVHLVATDETGWMGAFTLAEWEVLPLAPSQEDATT